MKLIRTRLIDGKFVQEEVSEKVPYEVFNSNSKMRALLEISAIRAWGGKEGLDWRIAYKYNNDLMQTYAKALRGSFEGETIEFK